MPCFVQFALPVYEPCTCLLISGIAIGLVFLGVVTEVACTAAAQPMWTWAMVTLVVIVGTNIILLFLLAMSYACEYRGRNALVKGFALLATTSLVFQLGWWAYGIKVLFFSDDGSNSPTDCEKQFNFALAGFILETIVVSICGLVLICYSLKSCLKCLGRHRADHCCCCDRALNNVCCWRTRDHQTNPTI